MRSGRCQSRGLSFYPRHPRGWRQRYLVRQREHERVSIHATLAGGDSARIAGAAGGGCFYPRHPRGWRRVRARVDAAGNQVSIHATLAGGDLTPRTTLSIWLSFYPRHPRGWRHHIAGDDERTAKFLSTPPSRVATALAGRVGRVHRSFLSTPPSRVATDGGFPLRR